MNNKISLYSVAARGGHCCWSCLFVSVMPVFLRKLFARAGGVRNGLSVCIGVCARYIQSVPKIACQLEFLQNFSTAIICPQ